MLIELAHYTLLFALTVVGLQTFLLCPTLWSGGSAIAIKLGIRGICFTAGLLFFSFIVLLAGFAVHDFSLAIVFEAFDSRTGPFYALQAFGSTREGLFFIYIILFAVAFLTGFSKNELATYQERGRYLFAGGFLIFSLLILMISTANPFLRIEEPPFEGIGFKAEWRPPYKILFTLFSFGSCACLTASFVKMICMRSKGRQFVRPVLRADLTALIFLACALGTELMTGFTNAGDGVLWQWTPVNSLLSAIFLLITGQTVLLFFCLSAPVFTNWIIFSAFAATSLSNAFFLTLAYRLFTLADSENYFPNPLVALCALIGSICFFLFLNSITLKKPFKESSFSLFSRESFIGIFFASLMAASVSVGLLSLLPALFMFLPDLPLRLLPALIKNTLIATVGFASVFFFIAFKRKSVAGGWIKPDIKSALIFWSGLFILAGLCWYAVSNAGRTVMYSLPAVLVFASVVGDKPLTIPRSPKEAFALLRSVPAFRYGVFFCALGFFVFSAAISCSLFNQTTRTATLKLQETADGDFPCAIEQLSEKTATSAARYRMICQPPVQILTGNLNFQWREKELKARFLQTNRFSTRLIQVDQEQEEVLKVRTIYYPALQLSGSGILLICLGLFFLLFSVKKEAIA